MSNATIQVRPVLSGTRWVWRLTQQAGENASTGDGSRKEVMGTLHRLVEGYLQAGMKVVATVTDQTENGFRAVYHPDGRMEESQIQGAMHVLGPRCSDLPRFATASGARRQALRVPREAKPAKPVKAEKQAKPVKPAKAAKPAKPTSAPQKQVSAKPKQASAKPAKPAKAAKAPREAKPPRETMLGRFVGLTTSAQRKYVQGLAPMHQGLLRAQARKHGTSAQVKLVEDLLKPPAPPPAPSNRSASTPRASAPRTSATLPPAASSSGRSPARRAPAPRVKPSRSQPVAASPPPPRVLSDYRAPPLSNSAGRNRAPVETPRLSAGRGMPVVSAASQKRVAQEVGNALADKLKAFLTMEE